MLATAADEKSGAYLRSLWRSEPERRAVIAMALAQKPDGENWDYLVRSLNVLEDQPAEEVVKALKTVRVATDDPMAIRQLILLGRTRGREEKGASRTSKPCWNTGPECNVLKKPRPPCVPGKNGTAKCTPIDRRQNCPRTMSHVGTSINWLAISQSDAGKFGDPVHGRAAFNKAKCAQCHQFGNYGEAIGPSLSGISRRFSKREILESILYPAHVVSDQYASKKVLTLDGQALIGMVSQRNDQSIEVRDANNQVVTVQESEIDQILPSNSSIMPSGLLDDLTLQEISDMMAYLGVIPPLEVASRP